MIIEIIYMEYRQYLIQIKQLWKKIKNFLVVSDLGVLFYKFLHSVRCTIQMYDKEANL